MFHDFTNEELRTYCRISIESLELWGRRLINDLFTEEYGCDYFSTHINNSIRKNALTIKSSRNNNVPLIDCIFFNDLISIIANPNHFKILQIALSEIYPNGENMARFILEKIVPVRNSLAHANPISVRQAEQVICYSNDFIDAVKTYYKKIGKEQMWNVPTIIHLTDSLGNVFTSLDNNVKKDFYVGEMYTITAEIDSSFARSDYTICWLRRSGHEYSNSHDKDKLTIIFSDEDVNEQLSIRCSIISKKKWHKHDYNDDEKRIQVRVFPK